MKEGHPWVSINDLFKYTSSTHKRAHHPSPQRSNRATQAHSPALTLNMNARMGEKFFFSTTLETNTINKSKRRREG